MNVFLRLHGDTVVYNRGTGGGGDADGNGASDGEGELVKALKQWRQEQERSGRRVGELVGYCSGLVGFLRNPRT